MDPNAIACSLCGYLSPTLKLSISHLRLVHHGDPSFDIECGIGGCTQRFHAFPAFNSHVYRVHRDALGLVSRSISQQDNVPDSLDQIQSTSLGEDQDYESQSSAVDGKCIDTPLAMSQVESSADRNKKQALYLLKLRVDKQVSQTAICDIIANSRKLCQQTAANLVGRIRNTLLQAQVEIDCVSGLSEALESPAPDSFDGIDTSYLLEKYAKDHLDYVVRQLYAYPLSITSLVYTCVQCYQFPIWRHEVIGFLSLVLIKQCCLVCQSILAQIMH